MNVLRVSRGGHHFGVSVNSQCFIFRSLCKEQREQMLLLWRPRDYVFRRKKLLQFIVIIVVVAVMYYVMLQMFGAFVGYRRNDVN